jgi:hypothetical protein
MLGFSATHFRGAVDEINISAKSLLKETEQVGVAVTL